MGWENERIREWEKFNFLHPADEIIRFTRLDNDVASSRFRDKLLKEWKSPENKVWRERRQAGFFVCGIAEYLQDPSVTFAMHNKEDEDIDIIVRWKRGNTLNFTPVQLKELRPDSRISLSDMIGKAAKKYPRSKDLTVAFYLNVTIGPEIKFELPLERGFGPLFFYGACTENLSEWMIVGNWYDKPDVVRYRMPWYLPE